MSDWVAGLGALAAVVVALITAMRSERAQRESTLGAVYAWAERNDGAWTLHFRNETSRPVYEWSADISWPRGSEVVSQAEAGIIVPGSHAYDWIPVPPPGTEAEVQLTLEFIDALGRRNVRNARGGLKVIRRGSPKGRGGR